jgi:hypothetical protein
MNQTTFQEVKNLLTDEIEIFAIIDRGNGEFTSMTKARYEELQAAQAQTAII